MSKLLLSIFCSLILLSCSFITPQNSLTLKRAPGFPQWLYGTDQTSGITFLDIDSSGAKHFLLADDTGALHRLVIRNDSIMSVYDISLGAQVISYLNAFPKWDFEEITYDRYTGKVYLSIEGNGPLYKDYVGIYQITFYNNNLYSDSVTTITRLPFAPDDIFLLHTAPNIGYEGFAVDDDYFYLGLEGFETGGFFADSSIIYIADKKSYLIIDSINTKTFGVSTVCGLFSDSSKSLYGIDRNSRKVFHITFDSKFKINKADVVPINSDVPKYHYEYVAALESITMDNENNLYLVDDPWKKFYVPSAEILSKMDNTTEKNFKNYIPIIYKFNTNY